ncbi:MAG TPA: zinc-dependent metalloprotease, partial [Acidobacteriota bacterium]|nr:zinc-dependent metalloprotease [Acidobacteriota bacterium]
SGYKPREFDPRCGFFDVSFMDYASPVGDPVLKHWIVRHRLQKKDPSAAVSDPVEPIVYYVDPGAPEPVRSALVEGAQWWNQAFEAAGYRNAFQVKILPPEADPMDVRYNTIQWVHRSTRGWSYGNTVVDPRTGEIIKGHVTLGSLRIRQDYLIAEGLLAPYEEGKPVPPDMLNMALARIRQLAAHEVGHTLGLSHNYIASTAGRASVMDYPQPLVQIRKDGTFDLTQAYAVGIGEWDKVTIAYGYQDFPEGADTAAKLNSILKDAMSRGLIFLTDQDARPPGSAHPRTHLWDNGANAVDELAHILEVRRLALSRFSEKNIRVGAPLATLEEALVPIYLYHRYQIDAVSKVLGGVEYTYALRGDGQKPLQIVTPEEQRRALDALLKTLGPETLALPESLLRLIPPHPSGYDRTNEVFALHTGMTFDPLSAAETAADMAVQMILQRERAARLVEYHARGARYPGLDEVAARLVSATWKAPHGDGYQAEIRRTVDTLVLSRLMGLAADTAASNSVRAVATAQIESLRAWLIKQSSVTTDSLQKAHYQYALAQIKLFQEDPKKVTLTAPAQPPAGPPIGSDDFE